MACSPSKPLPWTPTPHTYTPRFVPCERMWPGSHPRGGVNPNDGLLRHIAQIWASLSSWPSLPIGSGPPSPPLRRPTVWCGSSGSMWPVCTHCPMPSCPVLPASTHRDSATGGRPVVSVQYTISAVPQYVSSSEATAMHNGTKTLSITIKWVCAEKGGICRGWGEEFVCPECSRGMWRSNVGRQRLRTGGGWQCVAFGKIRIGKEWTCCLLIEWAQELQKSLIKQEVLSNHCSLPLFHNQECNYNIMRVAWHGLHKPFTDTEPQNSAVFMQPYCHLTNKHL